MTKRQKELLADLLDQFVVQRSAPQVEAFIKARGYTAAELDEALSAFGDEAGAELGWL